MYGLTRSYKYAPPSELLSLYLKNQMLILVINSCYSWRFLNHLLLKCGGFSNSYKYKCRLTSVVRLRFCIIIDSVAFWNQSIFFCENLNLRKCLPVLCVMIIWVMYLGKFSVSSFFNRYLRFCKNHFQVIWSV